MSIDIRNFEETITSNCGNTVSYVIDADIVSRGYKYDNLMVLLYVSKYNTNGGTRY